MRKLLPSEIIILFDGMKLKKRAMHILGEYSCKIKAYSNNDDDDDIRLLFECSTIHLLCILDKVCLKG